MVIFHSFLYVYQRVEKGTIFTMFHLSSLIFIDFDV